MDTTRKTDLQGKVSTTSKELWTYCIFLREKGIFGIVSPISTRLSPGGNHILPVPYHAGTSAKLFLIRNNFSDGYIAFTCIYMYINFSDGYIAFTCIYMCK